MKTTGTVLGTLLLFLNSALGKEATNAPALQFDWPRSERFQVEELIEKKGNRVQIVFKCQLSETNQEFILRWLDAEILSFNGKKVSESEDLKRELEPVQAMFRYPPFRISREGHFVETLDVEEAMKETNRLLDKVAPDRPKDSRKFFDKLARSKTGKRMVDRVYGQIWETWVEMWADVNLPAGQTASKQGKVPFGESDEFPAKMKLSNLGPLNSDTNLLSLKYEERVTGKNFGATLNKFAEKVAKETDVKKADPLPKKVTFERATIVEVHTDPKTLRPDWAKRSVMTSASAPGEDKETSLEVNEYRFRWDIGDASKPGK
jgi:hypothetical protein